MRHPFCEKSRNCLIFGLTLLAVAAFCRADGVEAITKPSEEVTLTFGRPGRIARVLVKEGDRVEAGQELAVLDDEAERLQVEQLRVQAEDTVRVRAAEAQFEQKKVDAAKWEDVFQRGGATGYERDHARLEAVIAELSLEMARFEHEQNKRKYMEAKVQLERMRLRSPLAARVEDVFASAGESVDPASKVVRVVVTDPLWIDVPVPLERGRMLKVGDGATVLFPDDRIAFASDGRATAGRFSSPAADGDSPKTAVGRLIHVAAVADAASNTLRVRVEVPNPAGRPAGEQVTVTFPQATQRVGGREAAPPAEQPPSESETEGEHHGP